MLFKKNSLLLFHVLIQSFACSSLFSMQSAKQKKLNTEFTHILEQAEKINKQEDIFNKNKITPWLFTRVKALSLFKSLARCREDQRTFLYKGFFNKDLFDLLSYFIAGGGYHKNPTTYFETFSLGKKYTVEKKYDQESIYFLEAIHSGLTFREDMTSPPIGKQTHREISEPTLLITTNNIQMIKSITYLIKFTKSNLFVAFQLFPLQIPTTQSAFDFQELQELNGYISKIDPAWRNFTLLLMNRKSECIKSSTPIASNNILFFEGLWE